MGYIANFIVYTLAMLGVIVFALFVFKKTTCISGGKSSKHLKIVDSMSLGQRKTLYIVSTGKEKFLIAGDVDRTTLISKLETEVEPQMVKAESIAKEESHDIKQTFQDTMKSLPQFSYIDKSILNTKHNPKRVTSNTINSSVMRNLAERIKN